MYTRSWSWLTLAEGFRLMKDQIEKKNQKKIPKVLADVSLMEPKISEFVTIKATTGSAQGSKVQTPKGIGIVFKF